MLHPDAHACPCRLLKIDSRCFRTVEEAKRSLVVGLAVDLVAREALWVEGGDHGQEARGRPCQH